jgi:C1A family cysteine protease
MGRSFGWVKDPEDSRDFPAKKLILAKKAVFLPEEYIVNKDTIIYDQGSTPRCVAYSSSGVKTDEEFLQYKQQYKFDADWLYSECKKIDGIPNQEGTYPRIACKILMEKGTKLAASGCFLKKAMNKPDKKWAIAGYYRLENSLTDNDIKQILFTYGSFLAASSWYANWSDKFSVFPEPKGGSEGGHAYRVIGWNKTGWIVANSWGSILWGDKGIATMPFNIFREHVLSEGDSWKLVDATI